MANGVEAQCILRQILEKDYQRRRATNPAFSKRAYARTLKINPITLSQFMKGKRQISGKIAKTVLAGLGTEESEQRALLTLFESTSSRMAAKSAPRSLDSLSLAVLSLFDTADFRLDTRWISKRLGVEESEVVRCFEQLLKHGMLEKKEDVIHISAAAVQAVFVADPLTWFAEWQNRVRPNINEGEGALCIAVNPERIPEAQEMVKRFQERLLQFLRRGRRREVIALVLCLLPLSQPIAEESGSSK